MAVFFGVIKQCVVHLSSFLYTERQALRPPAQIRIQHPFLRIPLASILFCPLQALIHDSHPPTEAKSGFQRVFKPQTSFQSNIQPQDINPINVDGAVCRFTLNDATGGFGAVFNAGLAVDTLQQLHSHPEICHLCNIFHT